MNKMIVIFIVLLLAIIGLSGCIDTGTTYDSDTSDTKYNDNTHDESDEKDAESDDEPDDIMEMIFGDDSYLRIQFEVKTWAAYATPGNMYADVKVTNKYWAPTVDNSMQLFQFTGKNVQMIVTVTAGDIEQSFSYNLPDVSTVWTTTNKIDIDFDKIVKSNYDDNVVVHWKASIRESGVDYGSTPVSGSFTMVV